MFGGFCFLYYSNATLWMCIIEACKQMKVQNAILFMPGHAFFYSDTISSVVLSLPVSHKFSILSHSSLLLSQAISSFKGLSLSEIAFPSPHELISPSARFCCNHPEHSEKMWPQKSMMQNPTYFSIWELWFQEKYTKFIDSSSFRMWKAS